MAVTGGQSGEETIARLPAKRRGAIGATGRGLPLRCPGALEREDATRDGLGVRVESEAVLRGIFDGRVVKVGHNSARNRQVIVGAQSSVSANDKSVRVAAIIAEISLRHQSRGGLGEFCHAVQRGPTVRKGPGTAHSGILLEARVSADRSTSPTFAIFAQILRMRFPAPRARIAKGSRSRTRHACVWRTGLPAFVRRLR